MAGYHASTGSHHCVLCGNRFKYDYNLLYHYRRSCVYTKAFIDRDVREQVDSTSLRKLVRNVAQNQPSLPPSLAHRSAQPQTDRLIHKEMLMGPPQGNAEFDDKQLPMSKIAAANVQPHRHGLPSGYKCPHCEIVFYGHTAIRLHMRMRHSEEFVLKTVDDEEGGKGTKKAFVEENEDEEVTEEVQQQPQVEQPPQLEIEPESEQPAVRPERRGRVLDNQGNDITSTPMVQDMIATGQLELPDGEDILLVLDNGDGEMHDVHEEGYYEGEVGIEEQGN